MNAKRIHAFVLAALQEQRIGRIARSMRCHFQLNTRFAGWQVKP